VNRERIKEAFLVYTVAVVGLLVLAAILRRC